MKKAPRLVKIGNIVSEGYEGPLAQAPSGRWVPARPLGLFSLGSRLGLALGVFTGKWDALEWEEQ